MRGRILTLWRLGRITAAYKLKAEISGAYVVKMSDATPGVTVIGYDTVGAKVVSVKDATPGVAFL